MNVPLSPRRRRLRLTIVSLSALFLAGCLAGVWFYARSRPKAYRPDEKPSDITSELDRNVPAAAPRPRLTGVSREAGLADFRNFKGDRTSQLPEDMGPGLAWGDFDNDGNDDLLVVSAGGALTTSADQLAPCVLYKNLGNGTFRRVAEFPEIRIHGMGAAWGDYDGDGFLDLVITGYNAIELLHNEAGTGRFKRDTRLPALPGFWSSPAWGDFDNDRRLDLYVCNYVQYLPNDADSGKISQQIGTAVPYTLNPSSYAPGLNALFHQLPDGRFVDVAAELKVQSPEGRSLGGVWHDFDQDGWLDLYVANDVSDNVLYHNAHGRFEDISHPAWVADYRSSMGMAVGDFDRDGDDDIFISHWVAQENALYENLLVNKNARPQTNAALTNKPPMVFVDIADQKGLGQIALPYVGWGTEFVDLDQDGWLDLLVANGSTLEMDGNAPKQLQPQEMFLFWNQHGQYFHNLAPLNPALAAKHVSRGVACADFDNDGDMDFAVADLGEGVRLFRNDMAAGHWLKVRLRSRNADGVANGCGEGAVATAWVDGVPLRRCVGGVSYLSQGSHTLHWGLGDAKRVQRFEVRWHAGETNSFDDLEGDCFYEISEGQVSARKLAITKAPQPASAGTALVASSSGNGERDRVTKFWSLQRAAMEAMKVEHDNAKAVRLFQQVITLNPQHEDSLYYLGLCLANEGEMEASLDALKALQKVNPQSHRGWQQWGVIRAISAKSDDDLAAAEKALERAHQLNPEETGALLVLGEIAVMRGQDRLAEERLGAATHTNPKAVGGFFLRGYLAWKRGEMPLAKQYLEQARTALGPEWKPAGTTSEGDVKRKQHLENTPLASAWGTWNGVPDPQTAFGPLEAQLRATTRPK